MTLIAEGGVSPMATLADVVEIVLTERLLKE